MTLPNLTRSTPTLPVFIILLGASAMQLTLGSVIIQKSKDPLTDTTFEFPIQAHVTKQSGEVLFVGAHPSADGAGKSKEYAITMVPFGSMLCTPVARETVTLDGVKEQKNPLYDAGIAHLDLLATKADVTYMSQSQGNTHNNSLIVVTSKSPADIYLVENTAGHTIYSAKEIKDANGKKTAGIIKITGTIGDRPFVVAAVKSAEGTFGQPGSGIALVNVVKHTKGSGQVESLLFSQLDAQEAKHATSPRALPVDCSSAALKIAHDLAEMGSVVDMHLDIALSRLYIALQVKSGAANDAGARALVMAAFYNTGEMKLVPIAPEDLFVGTNHIVGARGAHQSVSAHSVQTWWSSTGLPYLIIGGGNGTPEETANQVYALPLVTSERAGEENNIAILGTLASKKSIPQELPQKSTSTRATAVRRALTEPALTSDDSYTTDDLCTRIGGGPLAAGPIKQIVVHGDTVCALVCQPAENHIPGIYLSHALFDEYGQVKAWTQWKLASRLDSAAFGFAVDSRMASTITLNGANANQIDTVRSTFWSSGQENGLASLNGLLETTLPSAKGGIQGLFEFSKATTPGLDRSLIVATGLETVVCVRIADGAHKPVEQSDVSLLTGGALAQIGAIKSADIAFDVDSNKHLLFVGGSKGLAVITNTQKNEWKKLPSSVIGDYKYVRKVVCDRNHVYVLTDTTLDRIDIRALNAGATTLARKADFAAEHAILNDLLVSNGYALLATHKGLFATGAQVDSATARSTKDMLWTPVSVPGKVQAVYRLSTATATGRDQDLTSGVGGMVYTLSGKMSEQSSFFSRFTIQNTDAGTTLVPLRDKVVNNKVYPFLTFDTFKQFCVTDGAYFVHGVNKEASKLPTLGVGKHRSSPKIPLDFSDASRMTCALRSALLGSWLVAGDFGIKVNE